MMSYVMVDIETDGPIPVDYSMICFGAVIVDETLSKRFYGQLQPISEQWIPESLNISGFSRDETLRFDDPKEVMIKFNDWLQLNRRNNLVFISDNNGFDWQFINYYFHHFLGNNPFGHSSMNLGSLYKGLVKNMSFNFKHLRKMKHTHNPVDDAIGNAQAFLYMKTDMGLKLTL